MDNKGDYIRPALSRHKSKRRIYHSVLKAVSRLNCQALPLLCTISYPRNLSTRCNIKVGETCHGSLSASMVSWSCKSPRPKDPFPRLMLRPGGCGHYRSVTVNHGLAATLQRCTTTGGPMNMWLRLHLPGARGDCSCDTTL